MDVGIFMVSGWRLRAWLIIPPLIMVSVGMGSHAWQQKAEWQLQETTALSEVLPSFITARKEAIDLVEGFKSERSGELASKDQLGSFLQDMAEQNNFSMGTAVSMPDQKNKQQKAVPVQNFVVVGAASFTDIQLFINEVKTEQKLLSVNSIQIKQPTELSEDGLYDVEIVFELLLLDEMKAFNGGVQ